MNESSQEGVRPNVPRGAASSAQMRAYLARLDGELELATDEGFALATLAPVGEFRAEFRMLVDELDALIEDRAVELVVPAAELDRMLTEFRAELDHPPATGLLGRLRAWWSAPKAGTWGNDHDPNGDGR